MSEGERWLFHKVHSKDRYIYKYVCIDSLIYVYILHKVAIYLSAVKFTDVIDNINTYQ